MEEGTLLLLGHVAMSCNSVEATRELFREGLGGELQLGCTEMRLEKAQAVEGSTWPGQMYIWVEDLQRSYEKCRPLL